MTPPARRVLDQALTEAQWTGLHPPYATIVADPPWPAATSYRKGGRRHHDTSLGYTPMTVDAILAIPVADLAAADAHLFLWVPSLLFREGVGVQVARAWGFTPGTEIVWRKVDWGMGSFPRIGHEYLLPARRGQARWHGPRNVHSVQTWPSVYAAKHHNRSKVHSAKPPAAYDLIEQQSSGPYIELFARQPRLGWDSWGHGYEGLGA
jgi:N6-adenosine-specific RNA methylase IME4